MKYTVIGGNGFIGNQIVLTLKENGEDVYVPVKGGTEIYNEDLGIVIYAAGYGDCKENPLKVIDSNLSSVVDLIKNCKFVKLIYISSTRLYINQESSLESSDVKICFNDNRSLFNLTKLTSEKLILNLVDNAVIVRPSNVYGLAVSSPLFLPSIVRDAISKNEVTMYISKNYEKDYVSVLDVADSIYKLSKKEKLKSKIFNLASGENTSAKTIADILINKTGCKVSWKENETDDEFSIIDIENIKSEIDYSPSQISDNLDCMIESFLRVYNNNECFTI
jgi:nucleoside-diphosphate-sugar epimerase